MTYLKTSLLLFLFLFAGSSLNAQQLHFNSLTVNDGLSQHDASSIIKDSYGFIWVGTYDGLNRFDGYSIKNYYSAFDDENSLSSNRIKCLFEDSKKRIWIGTQGSGLNYYSLKDDKFYRIKTNERYSFINCIAENKFGEILIGTTNGILKIKEGEKLRIQFYEGIIISKKNFGVNKTFTVLKILQGIGIERCFLEYSPKIDSILIKKSSKIRHSKLYYLRKNLRK